jgi:hypothetical protein
MGYSRLVTDSGNASGGTAGWWMKQMIKEEGFGNILVNP